MNKKSYNNYIIDYYRKQKEKEIKKLEEKNKEYKLLIEKEKKLYYTKEKELKKKKIYNDELKRKYDMLKELFYHKGIIINIKNKGFNIKEWDNLYMNLKEDKYVVISKNGEIISILDSKITNILKELLKEKEYSLVVIRVDNNIKIQLRCKN